MLLRWSLRNGTRLPLSDRSIGVPFGHAPAIRASRLAVICHLFHVDLIADIHARLRHIPGTVNLYVSTDSNAKAARIEAAFADWPNGAVEVRVVENRGRDIAPKFVTFGPVLGRYPLVLCLHTKKSLHYGRGDEWRDALLDSLAGSAETVASILALFEADHTLGLVFPQHFEPIRRFSGWAESLPEAQDLAGRMGIAIDPRRRLDIASGSMFWARPAALQPILDLGLTIEDFPPEAGQNAGTTAHTLERLILYACEKAGFTWLKVAAPAHFVQQRTILRVRRAADLAAAMKRAEYRLL